MFVETILNDVSSTSSLILSGLDLITIYLIKETVPFCVYAGWPSNW